MAPLPAPAEKPSHRVSDSQSHAKVRPPTQVAVFCAALWPNLQPALTVDLYESLAEARKARNQLSHDGKHPNEENATAALFSVKTLLGILLPDLDIPFFYMDLRDHTIYNPFEARERHPPNPNTGWK